MIRQLLLLGDPRLRERSSEVGFPDPSLCCVTEDLRDTLHEFRRRYGAGRAIAAPQIGVFKRLIYLEAEGRAESLINPEIIERSSETFEVWDDCMCFPELLIRVERHVRCTVRYFTMEGEVKHWQLRDSLSELFQHEIDHLDGILATDRMVGRDGIKLLSWETASQQNAAEVETRL